MRTLQMSPFPHHHVLCMPWRAAQQQSTLSIYWPALSTSIFPGPSILSIAMSTINIIQRHGVCLCSIDHRCFYQYGTDIRYHSIESPIPSKRQKINADEVKFPYLAHAMGARHADFFCIDILVLLLLSNHVGWALFPFPGRDRSSTF